MTLFDPEAGAPAPSPGSDAPPEPGADTVRIRMTLAYDGAGFRGFAVQPGVPTVAGALAEALHSAVGHPVHIVCAGRTDAGVHAAGQVVHFDVNPGAARPSFRELLAEAVSTPPDAPSGQPAPTPSDAASGQPAPTDAPLPGEAADPLHPLRRACNRMLSPRIVVRSACVAPPGFDARRSALWRHYRYTVLNREDPDPLLARTTWHIDEPLDLRVMQLACDALYGEHDFACFCRQRPDGTGSTVRRVIEAEWSVGGARPARPPSGRAPESPPPELLLFDIRASAFCHQMVRSIVGTMVDVGRGRLHAGDMTGIILSRDRKAAGVLAPPQGLCLEEVGY